MIRAVAFASVLASCAPRALTISDEHPANPAAASGRSAGPPPALRPGVATLDEPELPPAIDHSQHAPPPDADAKPADKPATPGTKVDTIEDTAGEPKRVDPEKKVEPAKDKPPATKVPPKKPTQKQPPKPKPTEPKPTEPAKPPPMPPMDHSGHGGHQ